MQPHDGIAEQTADREPRRSALLRSGPRHRSAFVHRPPSDVHRPPRITGEASANDQAGETPALLAAFGVTSALATTRNAQVLVRPQQKEESLPKSGGSRSRRRENTTAACGGS